MTGIYIPVTRSVSKLAAPFIAFYKPGDPSTGFEYCDQETARFYHLMHTSDEAVDEISSEDTDLEFQIQVDSKLYPEYPCRSMTECFIMYERRLIDLCFINIQ